MANKHTKRCSAACVIRKMPIKAIKRSHCTPIGIVNREKTDHTKGW